MMVSGPVFPAITLCMSSDILKAPCIGIWVLTYMGLEADGICVSVFTLSIIRTFLILTPKSKMLQDSKFYKH